MIIQQDFTAVSESNKGVTTIATDTDVFVLLLYIYTFFYIRNQANGLVLGSFLF